MTDDEEQAEAAATWDQVEAILDGFPVLTPRPGAKRVANLVAEVKWLRAEAERERAAVVAWLREGAGGEQGRVEYADDIERGEHRREEK